MGSPGADSSAGSVPERKSHRLPWREALLAVASTILGAGLVELAGQAYATFHPAYDVLNLEPNRDLGWTEVPGLKWTWAGFYWYANEYSVEIATNSFGFRDKERSLEKPPGVVRLAALGDSYVEALQVPLEKTALGLLEARLNARGSGIYEVLNFGISGYGLGQEYLSFKHYAKRFSPDLVFVFCGTYHMWRTTDAKAGGAFPGTKENRLWIRPTFHLSDGELVLDPPKDFDAFVERQHFVMETYFGGKRWARRHRELFLRSYVQESWDRGAHLLGAVIRGNAERPVLRIFRDPSKDVLELNLKILEELVKEAASVRCRVVVVDTSRFFNAKTTLPATLKGFCAARDVLYLSLADDLLAAEAKKQKVQLPLDTHFNELGNRITADALLRAAADAGVAAR